MRSGLPPLNWLRAFEAAARQLSFTGAAGELNMTQSAVSQQIKSLETHLGRPLFFRGSRSLQLTEAGITYLPVVRDAFHTLSMGTRAITTPAKGIVQVQCNLTFAIHWLAPRMQEFQKTYPDIKLNIVTELWERREMAQGIDLEIRFSLRPEDGSRAELLRRDMYYPVCAPGYEVAMHDLFQKPLFDCSNLLCTWSVWAEEQGLNWPNPHVTYATTFSFSLSAAMAGAGLCLAHDAIADRLISDQRLIAPFEYRAPMQEAYYLIQGPQSESRDDVQAFAQWLRDEMQEEKALGLGA